MVLGLEKVYKLQWTIDVHCEHELKPTQEFPSSLFFNTIRRKNYLKHFPSNNLLSLREEKRNLIRLLAGKNTPTSSRGLNYASNWLIDFPQYLKNWTACLKCCQIYSLYVSFVLWRSGADLSLWNIFHGISIPCDQRDKSSPQIIWKSSSSRESCMLKTKDIVHANRREWETTDLLL